MHVPQIILLVLLVLLLCLLGLFLISHHQLKKKATKYDTIGTTLRWQDSKFPFLGRIIVEYTKKGKPYQTATALMPKPKTLKLGAKNRWTIYTYHIPNKTPLSKAKRYKNKRDVPSAPSSPVSASRQK